MNWNIIFDSLTQWVTSAGMKIVASILVLIIGHRLIKWLKKRIARPTRADGSDVSARLFIASFAGVTLYVLLFLTIAMILGIPTTSFITAIASCGVAIGLAMQGFLSNFAGGIMLMIFKPFKVGDYIETPDAAGTVAETTVVYTVLNTPDNKVITIPNGNLTNSVIRNYSAVDKRRVDLVFSTAYSCDVEDVKNLLMGIVTKHSKVLGDPEPFARLSAHGESALEFTVRVWCRTEDFWDVKFDLTEQVKIAFDKQGIEIPYPQMDIHMK